MMKSRWPRSYPPILIWGISLCLIGGIGLRVFGLESKIFWIDEVFTGVRLSGFTTAEVSNYLTSQSPLSAATLDQFQYPAPHTTALDTLSSLATEEPHLPPLYFLLTRGWLQRLPDQIWAIRSFSVVISSISLVLMYWLGRSLFNSPLTGAIAASLMAVSPMHWVYAQEARPYSLWGALILLSTGCLLRAWRRRQWQDWGLYTLATTALFYTFLYSLWVVLAQGVALMWGTWRQPTAERTVLKSLGLATAIALLSFVPWLVALAQHWQTGLQFAQWQRTAPVGGIGGLVLAWGLHLCRLFVDFEATYPFNWQQPLPYGLVVVASLGLGGYSLYYLWRTAPRPAPQLVLSLSVVPAVAMILPDLILGTQQSIATRYFMPVLLAIELAVAYMLTGILGHLPHPRTRNNLGMVILSGLWALGLVACLTNSLAQTTWGKSGGYIPYVAAAINRSEAPIVISDIDLWVVSLAHELDDTTAIAVFDSRHTVPPMPSGYSDYFLYGLPEDVADSLSQSGYRIARFDGLDRVPIWCFYPDGVPVKNCPDP